MKENMEFSNRSEFQSETDPSRAHTPELIPLRRSSRSWISLPQHTILLDILHGQDNYQLEAHTPHILLACYTRANVREIS